MLELCRIGIDAFKIEGRLKSPEWVAAVTRYYRSILDTDSTPHRHAESRTHTPDPPQGQYPKSPKTQEAFEQACWIFSRSLTEGYVSSIREWEPASAPPGSKGFPGILDPRFPGHRGVPIGTVEAVERNRFLIKPKRGLAVRDGLQFFRPLQGIRMESVPFGIERIWLTDTRDTSGKISGKSPRREAIKRGIRRQTSLLGKPILSCKAGQPVWIETPKSVLPTPGTEIYLISTHADTLPEAPRNIPRKRIPLALSVALNPCSPDFHPGANPGSQQEMGTVSGERSVQYAWLAITVHEGHADKTQGANPSTEAILTWEGLFLWKRLDPVSASRRWSKHTFPLRGFHVPAGPHNSYHRNRGRANRNLHSSFEIERDPSETLPESSYGPGTKKRKPVSSKSYRSGIQNR